MSGQSAKRQETTANASASVPAIVALPPELLEAVLGFLDVGTLCTARLVCAHFHSAASRCIHSVKLSVETLRSRPETTLANFPNLSRVIVFDAKADDLLMLTQTPVAAAVTHLRAVEYLRRVPRHTRHAPGLRLVPLPNLTSLTVGRSYGIAISFPQTLRELSLQDPIDLQTADLVAGLTNLTCLRIDVSRMAGSHQPDKPFEAVTALTALERLEIRSTLSLMPCVAALTLLTHLQFYVMCHELMPGPPSGLAHLASLRRLVHLGVTHIGVDLGRQLLAAAATFTGLKSLGLGLSKFRQPQRSAFDAVCMAPFSQLTALRLVHNGVDGSFFPRFKLERLQDLSLLHGLDRLGIAALRRATGLTRLSLRQVSASVGPEELGTALSRMSRLRALRLGHRDAAHVTCSLEAIALLSELTRLELRGPGIITNAAVAVCLGLRNLRVLHLIDPSTGRPPFVTPAPPDRSIREIFSAIAKLPELRGFGVGGGDLEDDMRAWLNAERRAKGWPPLKMGD